jgi:hypothetical protein
MDWVTAIIFKVLAPLKVISILKTLLCRKLLFIKDFKMDYAHSIGYEHPTRQNVMCGTSVDAICIVLYHQTTSMWFDECRILIKIKDAELKTVLTNLTSPELQYFPRREAQSLLKDDAYKVIDSCSNFHTYPINTITFFNIKESTIVIAKYYDHQMTWPPQKQIHIDIVLSEAEVDYLKKALKVNIEFYRTNIYTREKLRTVNTKVFTKRLLKEIKQL